MGAVLFLLGAGADSYLSLWFAPHARMRGEISVFISHLHLSHASENILQKKQLSIGDSAGQQE